MRRWLGRCGVRIGAATLVCLAGACAGPAPPPLPAPPPPLPATALAPARSAAWIRYAGDQPHEISHSIREDGGCLTVTSTGLRATSPPSASGDCSGPWQIATQRLPPIAAVRRIGAGFAFLTERGTAWISPSPLAATTSHVRPPPGLIP